jgi:hypothetical protein
MSTISWGRQQKITFSSCGSLDNWVAPVMPAVFAVTYHRDPRNKPKAHTVLYFGESDDLSQHALSIKRQLVENWEGNSLNDLFVFVHPMAGSTRIERARVQEQLVLEYQPYVNSADG